MSIIYIYSLIDPITFEPRYIGQSSDSDEEKRYRDHLRDAPNSETDIWISELKRNGLKPILKIEERNSSLDRESLYVLCYKTMGFNITNITYAKHIHIVRRNSKIIKRLRKELNELRNEKK